MTTTTLSSPFFGSLFPHSKENVILCVEMYRRCWDFPGQCALTRCAWVKNDDDDHIYCCREFSHEQNEENPTKRWDATNVRVNRVNGSCLCSRKCTFDGISSRRITNWTEPKKVKPESVRHNFNYKWVFALCYEKVAGVTVKHCRTTHSETESNAFRFFFLYFSPSTTSQCVRVDVNVCASNGLRSR